jgi:hypothetical protein
LGRQHASDDFVPGTCEDVTEQNTAIVLAIPIPSIDPVFLTTIGIHVVFGLAAVITGVAAMLSEKGRGTRTRPNCC